MNRISQIWCKQKNSNEKLKKHIIYMNNQSNYGHDMSVMLMPTYLLYANKCAVQSQTKCFSRSITCPANLTISIIST